MHRISAPDLRTLIYVKIRAAPKLVLNGLRSKLPVDGDKAAGELAELICREIDNGSRMVIQAEIVGLAPATRLGVWGVDEPDPTA